MIEKTQPQGSGRIHLARLMIVSPEEWPDLCAGYIARLLGEALAERPVATFCVAGGQGPVRVYHRLATLPVAWERVDLFFGDERAVPPGDDRSNYHMVCDALVSRLPKPPRNLHRMRAESVDLGKAIADYAALLPERLDVLMLGMGDDGHTASLFPGSEVLEERTEKVAEAKSPDGMVRMTITPPVIAASRATVVMVAGKGKAAVLDRVLVEEGSAYDCPARLAKGGYWLLDTDAASGLPNLIA